MDVKGYLKSITKNIFSGKFELTFEVDTLDDAENFKNQLLSIKAVKYKNKRSVNANNYYWFLCSEMARVLNTSLTEMHNTLLQRYGTLETDKDGFNYMIVKDSIDVRKLDTIHLYPTSKTKVLDDNKLYRVYAVIKPTHFYNTEEMAKLINGTIEECKELGISTAAKDEVEKMLKKKERNGKFKYVIIPL